MVDSYDSTLYNLWRGVTMSKTIYLVLYNREANKSFKKYFDTEFNKNKFRRKLRYSKKLLVLEDSSDNELGG